MAETLLHRPDRWLLCTPAVADAVRRRWVANTPEGSFSRFRDEAGLIETVDLHDLRSRLDALRAVGCGAVTVVVARLGPEEIQTFDTLGHDDAETYLQSWQDERLEVGEALQSPDGVVLRQWSRDRRRPRVALEGPGLEDRSPAFAAALAQYEDGARAQHGSLFDEAYGPRLTELTPVADGAAEGIPAELAWQDDAGTRLTLQRLVGAGAGSFTATVVSPLSPQELAHQWRLELQFATGARLTLALPESPVPWQPGADEGLSVATFVQPAAVLGGLDPQVAGNVSVRWCSDPPAVQGDGGAANETLHGDRDDAAHRERQAYTRRQQAERSLAMYGRWLPLAAAASMAGLALLIATRVADDEGLIYENPPTIRGELNVVQRRDATPRRAAEELAADFRTAGLAPRLYQRGRVFAVDIDITADMPPAAWQAVQRAGLRPVRGVGRIEFAPQ